MKEFVKVGLIQPVIDPNAYWNCTPAFTKAQEDAGFKTPHLLNIHPIHAEAVWQEIQEGLRQLLRGDNRPDILLIPELHLPPSRLNDLKRICKRHRIMAVAGIDFQRNPYDRKKIRNRGALIIPGTIGTKKKHSRVTTLHFGKTYFTHIERIMFKNINGEIDCNEEREQNMYIFSTENFGNFGIMICSDIFDIERMILYQARIQHLIVISLNKDLNTYFSMAESLTRLLYCNVAICNTGFYGGSLAMSPYSDPNARIIYKYYGQKTLNIHLLNLPVKKLVEAQAFDFVNADKDSKGVKFKSSPPGYFDKYQALTK